MKAYEQTLNLLTSLKLKGILKRLDEIVSDAESRKDSYISFLNNIFHVEIEERARNIVDKYKMDWYLLRFLNPNFRKSYNNKERG